MVQCTNCRDVIPDFETVEACLKELIRAQQAGREIIFRGEACHFSSCSPGTLRVLMDENRHIQAKMFLIELAERLREEFEDDPEALEHCDMFLQHYGVPTDLIDFTGDPRVALHFACKDSPGHIGRVAILEAGAAEDAGFDVIRPLRFEFRQANLQRAEQQKAWALRHRAGAPKDLWSGDGRSRTGIRWVTFRKKLPDDDLFSDLTGIVAPSGDQTPARMREWLRTALAESWQEDKYIQHEVDLIRKKL